MKETGIIMSGDHPKLILDGIKTMTRRVINPQPYENTKFINPPDTWAEYWTFSRVEYDQSAHCVRCPCGQVGDRLWVRETHYRYGRWVENGLPKTSKQKWAFKALNQDVIYATATNRIPHLLPKDRTQVGWRRRPSIFMPRWASRITLEITEVRVERLQEITEEDARAEGCTLMVGMTLGGNMGLASARYSFMKLWDFLNARRGYSWESRPWVWVISFCRVNEV